MNAKIKITDNTNFQLVINIACYPVKSDIAFRNNFQLRENIYLKKTDENRGLAYDG
jgi:hypothetical protein